MTGRQWMKAQIIAAIERRPHKSATSPKAIEHFATEAREKAAPGQARIVLWDEIKNNIPPKLKISPLPPNPTNQRHSGPS
jgi:hypothetical protein